MSRTRKDASLIITVALAAAGANVNSDAIDFEAVAPGVTLETVELEVALPATPNLANDKSITVSVQDSADGVTFADIDSLASLIVTGADAAGAGAVTRKYKLPSDTRRYVRVNAATEADGGNNTAVEATIAPLF